MRSNLPTTIFHQIKRLLRVVGYYEAKRGQCRGCFFSIKKKGSIQHRPQLYWSTLFFSGLDVWWTNFKAYLAEEKNVSDWRSILVEGSSDSLDDIANQHTGGGRSTLNDSNLFEHTFNMWLSDFLFSKSGTIFKEKFVFDGDLTCNQPAPPIKVILGKTCKLLNYKWYCNWITRLMYYSSP